MASHYDLYRLPGGQGYVVDVQSVHASNNLRTRVVVPLLRMDDLASTISGLNPIVNVDGENYVFAAQALATMTLRELGEFVESLEHEHGEKFAYALDILLTGF